MAMKPPRPCAHPGCPELTRERYCSTHAKAQERQYDQARGTAAQRGYGAKWQRYRLAYLRLHPLCVMCEEVGRITPARDVDHIEAVDGPDDPKFWDPKNHRPLCHSHHSRKTVREDGGFGQKG